MTTCMFHLCIFDFLHTTLPHLESVAVYTNTHHTNAYLNMERQTFQNSTLCFRYDDVVIAAVIMFLHTQSTGGLSPRRIKDLTTFLRSAYACG